MDFCDLVRFTATPDLGLPFGFASVRSLTDVSGVEGSVQTNASLVSSQKYSFILDPHQDARKDFLQFRNCGLNHTLARACADAGITLGFSLHFLQTSAQIGRVMHALRLCRKYGVHVVLCSGALTAGEMRSVSDLASFGRILGLSGGEVLAALSATQSL